MQQHQLLQTKLYIPSIRPELVSRPRLIERLNAGLHGKLILVSAPAGFGKTTLVSEWAHKVRAHGDAPPHVAWLSLDEGDNAPACFLAYLIAALRTIEDNIGKGVLSALQSPQPPPAEAVLVSLINAVAALPGSTILVLDDHHNIESSPVDDALAFLLERLPPQMHLVIATREDPHLPLARLRARGQLTEVRASDLRFSSSEAAEFLNQAMGLDLSAEDIAALETRTEGWIAGLQLAGLALQGTLARQGTLSMQGKEDVTRRIQSFTGSHRYVLDYLIEEVLQQQPASVQTFLQQTAVLNRLTGSLCDAVTGQNDGQATLEMLDRANLFIVPLDEERRWYRYHHLFAELLQQRLAIDHPNSAKDLHSRAAIWYEAHGDLSEAIHHALTINDVETATRLIEKGAVEALERSELRFILNWVARLPESALKNAPWLFVYHCWALLISGQVEAASPRLDDTDWLLDSVADADETQRREMVGYVAGLKAQLCSWQRDYQNGIDFANQALASLPQNNWIRGYCAIVKGASFWGNGNLAAAQVAFAESAAVGQTSGNKMLQVSGACNLACSLELEGHLRQAVERYQATFRLAEQDGERLPVAGYIHVELARPLYELNELELASLHAGQGIKLCQRLADGRAEMIGHCYLARVHLAQGDFDNVVTSIQAGEHADPSPDTSFDKRGAEYLWVRLWLKQNKLQEVAAWLHTSDLNVDEISYFKTKMTYTMHARAMIALGRAQPEGPHLHEAQQLLKHLLELAESNGWGSKVIEILALQALALQERQESAQAMAKMERALTLAEPEGFIRTFVDEGPPMARLLYEALSRGIAPDYVRRLLAAFPDAAPEKADPGKTQTPESELVEPLSERELEVLELIAQGLTNREIASRLFLTLNTVKAHTRNIYGKLGVHSRTQAVAKAKALGVLTPN